jgi:hypothetical protein
LHNCLGLLLCHQFRCEMAKGGWGGGGPKAARAEGAASKDATD